VSYPRPVGTSRTCINCGKQVAPDRKQRCNHCGEWFYIPEDPLGIKAATEEWTLPVVVRSYDADATGKERMAKEVAELGLHGYEPTTQSEDGGHVHAGRLILTGGLSIFAGKAGIRSDGRLTVTFAKAPSQAMTDPIDQLRRLAELRDAGVVTPDEFEAKKADLLSRL
jgi:hypothetical protein